MSAISCQLSAFSKRQMNYPAAEQRGIRCHAGLVADCRCLISYSQPLTVEAQFLTVSMIRHPVMISGFRLLSSLFGGLAGMTTRRKQRDIKPNVYENKVLAD
jgi:hypothetical protein